MPSRIVAAYYWLTPLFWAADVVFGASFRAAALEGNPAAKTVYYLFCFACGIAIWARPALTGLIGLTEASIQILLLVLGVLLPYFRLIDRLAAGQAGIAPHPFGLGEALSFLLAGAVLTISFRLQARRLGRR